MRTVAEGRGDTLYVGTTRNCILQGSVHTGFSLLVQVSDSPAPALLLISLLFSSHFLPFLLTSPPHPLASQTPLTFPFTCSHPVNPPLSQDPCPRTPLLQQPTSYPLAEQRVPRTPPQPGHPLSF